MTGPTPCASSAHGRDRRGLSSVPIPRKRHIRSPISLRGRRSRPLWQVLLGGSDESLVLVEVDKHLKLVANAHLFGYVTGRKKDFSFFTSVKVNAEVYSFTTLRLLKSPNFILLLIYVFFVLSVGCFYSSLFTSSFSMVSLFTSSFFSTIPSFRCMVRSVIVASPSSCVTMTKVCPNLSRRSKKS